jgi:predicted glycoside hydrolase/deacetylase ChbG (UPF0249 family)
MTARRLIVSADDFGMAPGVDAGIAAAVAAGTVTSVGVMANLVRPERVAALRGAAPGLSLGVHLNLTTGRPVAGAAAVPSLVAGDGRFLPLATLTRRALAGRLRRADVAVELAAQVDALRAVVPLDHLDSHQHVHLLPGILAEVAALARRTGIRRLRSHLPRLVGPGGAAARVAYYARHPRRLATHAAKRLFAVRLRAAGLLLPDGMVSGSLLLGPVASRAPLAEWEAVCAGLPPGTWELVVHPADLAVPGTRELPALGALVERRAAELAALTGRAFPALLARHGITLVPFAAVGGPAVAIAAAAIGRQDVA